MNDVTRVVLIGFSGTGKTTVARLLAERLGWDRYDTDEAIEARTGITVPAFFAAHGEPAFRALERDELLRSLTGERVIVATGGGAVVDPAVWQPNGLTNPGTLVVALDAAPETMLDRLQRQHAAEGEAVERPMLAGNDPLARMIDLKERRQTVYDQAGITLPVDRVTPETVASEIASLIGAEGGSLEPAVQLEATSGNSDIFIAPGVATKAGELARATWPRARRAWIISDANVAALHGPAIERAFSDAEFSVSLQTVAPGEGSKSLQTVGLLYDWLLDNRIERGDVVVALGGGMTGDLAGFVAATVLRGVGFVQIPTSLLAMVDASVGGKTGVNHRAGKNLIGAFYQPPLVVIDPAFLATMPPRSLTEGWAEVIKHAVIQPSTPGGERADLLSFLQRNQQSLMSLREPATTYLIRRNVALKAAVVKADERESGLRALLNFGHTLGHAIEAADYRYLHGEAVAIGMRAATDLGIRLGMTDCTSADRLDALIAGFGLPATADVQTETVMSLLQSDKKRIAGTQRWIIPVSAGGVVMQDGIPEELVREALATVGCASRTI